jgi:hypothetical protein
MATTTNFNWETPDDTDLVKDGAAAMRTLGNSIDASFVDLKGGTTGQVLAKASGTDLDFSWVAQDDSNAIQNAIVDAKGDLIAATAADTPARLAVGTNGQILTADSTAATGLKWASPATGTTFSGCIAYSSTTLTLSGGVVTVLNWDSEGFDTDGYHSTSSNTSRITIPSGKTGYFRLYGTARFSTSNTGGIRHVKFLKNGAAFSPNLVQNQATSLTATLLQLAQTCDVYLSAGDYVTMSAYNENTSADLDETSTYFGIQYLGA